MKTLVALTIAAILSFPVSLPANPAAPSLEVIVLGSGGPRPFGRAATSLIVLLDGTPRILMDAGPGAFFRIGELNLDLQNVDTVLLTHLHIDHSGDFRATVPSCTGFLGRTARDNSPRPPDLWI